MTVFFICIKTSADTLDLGGGAFQEVPSGEETIDEGIGEEYAGSQEDSKDPAEDTQVTEEGTTEDYEGSTQSHQEGNYFDDDTQESEEATSADYEGSTQDDQNQEIHLESQEEIDVLTDIDNSIKKLTISLWCLFGLLLGTKLVKGLFGYGG